MAKKIENYFPGKPPAPATRNFQAKVELGLYDRARDKMQKQGYTWDELAARLLQFYLGEEPASGSKE